MSWNYETSLQRIKKHLGGMGKIEIISLGRSANLDDLLTETVCREIYGAHVYVQVSNFTALASTSNIVRDDYKNLIQAVHIYQRAVTQIVQALGGQCVHFQGAKLHALFYQPLRRRVFPRSNRLLAGERLAMRAFFLQIVLQDFVHSTFNPAFPGFTNFTLAGGADLGNTIGTSDGLKGDRELLFLGSAANYVAKIIGPANSLHLTDKIYSVLPKNLRNLCNPDGKDMRGQKLYRLAQVTSAEVDVLLKKYRIDYKRDAIAAQVQNDRRNFSLNKIEYSSAHEPINLDSLSIYDNKRVIAASIFADVAGFTRFIDAAKSERGRRKALRVFHAIRRELALVIKEDYHGLRIRYQGDRVQGLFHLPKDDKAAIARKAVEAAIGLQSSMRQSLGACLPEMDSLQLKVGIDMGITLVSKLGSRGERDRICLGEPVERAATCEEQSDGGQIRITEQVYKLLPTYLRKHFAIDGKTQTYVGANLIYKGKQ